MCSVFNSKWIRTKYHFLILLFNFKDSIFGVVMFVNLILSVISIFAGCTSLSVTAWSIILGTIFRVAFSVHNKINNKIIYESGNLLVNQSRGKINKLKRKICMRQTDISGMSESEIEELFKSNFREVLKKAKKERWEAVCTETHKLFVYGIIKEITGSDKLDGFKELEINKEIGKFILRWKHENKTNKK